MTSWIYPFHYCIRCARFYHNHINQSLWLDLEFHRFYCMFYCLYLPFILIQRYIAMVCPSDTPKTLGTGRRSSWCRRSPSWSNATDTRRQRPTGWITKSRLWCLQEGIKHHKAIQDTLKLCVRMCQIDQGECAHMCTTVDYSSCFCLRFTSALWSLPRSVSHFRVLFQEFSILGFFSGKLWWNLPCWRILRAW